MINENSLVLLFFHTYLHNFFFGNFHGLTRYKETTTAAATISLRRSIRFPISRQPAHATAATETRWVLLDDSQAE